ncbi:hypothetical protein, conserved [Trypanosoma brucei brucei TREU927]|uniref:Tyrosine phosphatase n=1 Tax=Trypanosoma brucei brucei (strain 927/4 GUTat10.1) TaxID=185431 RepID=Q38EE0_TRYB2|nr:hypothetical protein, conserved [Trypanosoma brucei brucei TREU927]EAN76830.1 hypothetical protein, conserved [Trypanosoma brucei brucei TREU927]
MYQFASLFFSFSISLLLFFCFLKLTKGTLRVVPSGLCSRYCFARGSAGIIMKSLHSPPLQESQSSREIMVSRTLDPALLNVVPPLRFAIVEEGVYRGAYPTLRNFPFLRSLGLRTIVSLTPEEPTYDLSRFAAAEGITIRHIQVEQNKGEAQLMPTDMSEVLQMLADAEQHPLYIHCLDGRHTTGLVVMGLRKLQHWSVNCSHMEYQRFAWNVQDEVAFIADYSGPVVVPKVIPSWLWNGSWCDVSGRPKRLHTGIRLKFPSVARDGLPSVEESTNPTKTTELNVALPLHTSPSAEGRATYVNVENVEPARPVFTAGFGSYGAAYAIQIERRLAADVRSLSLRASVDTALMPHQGTNEKYPRSGPLQNSGSTGVVADTGSSCGNVVGDSGLLGCGDTQQVSYMEAAEEANGSQHVRQCIPHGVFHSLSRNFGEENPPALLPKQCTRACCALQFLVAERGEGIVPAGEGGGNAKKSRRRNSV